MINIHIVGLETEKIHELLKTSLNYNVKFQVNEDQDPDKVIYVYDSWEEEPMEVEDQVNLCIVSIKARPRHITFNLLKKLPEVFCLDYKIFIKNDHLEKNNQ